MKNLSFFSTVFFLFPIALFCQELPFGVEGPLYWLEAREEGNQVILKENISQRKILSKAISEVKKTNNFLSFPLEIKDNHSLSFPLSQETAERYSIFIVYEPDDANVEQNLWTLLKTNREEALIIATNQRLADYTGEQFRSYPEKLNPEKVKIHYYQHYKKLEGERESKKAEVKSNSSSTINHQPSIIAHQPSLINHHSSTNNYTLNLGQKIGNIPSQGFTGKISEVLIYDRVLSTIEMQQVASYLAIKYGVSLHQSHFKNYYNSFGDKIWDYEQHKDFNQNITGLGRFENGNLSQSQSKNSNDEQVVGMVFSLAKKEEIPNETAVFWSDNGGELAIKPQKEGQPQGISRIWQLDLPNKTAMPLNWYFNPNSLIASHPSYNEEKHQGQFAKSDEPTAYYWLISDISGTGNFNPEQTTYVRLNKIEDPSTTGIQDILSNIRYSPSAIGNQPKTKNDEPTTSSLHYTIWQAPEMFAHLDVEQGKCQSDELGKLQFNVIGGESPYQIRVKSLEGKFSDQVWQEHQNKRIKELRLKSGRYVYEIKDRQNRTYQQEIYLTDVDAPTPKLNAEYILGSQPTILEVEKTLPVGNYSYQWYRDGNLISQNSNFYLSQAGNYELKIQNDRGCHSVTKFKAYYSLGEITKPQVTLYPNPSTDGHFRLMGLFPRTTSGILNIYNEAGRLLKSKNFYNIESLEHEDYLPTMGVYILHLTTTFGEESYKLIIK